MAIEDQETKNLIGSDKGEGTAVYGADNQKIGSIQQVMIDKISGQVRYAVVSFGGFLGIGDDHYPLPWQSLTSAAISLASPKTSCRVRQSTAMIASGIGQTLRLTA